MKLFHLFAALLTLTAVAGCKKNRTPDKVVFAEGFTGAAVVLYGVASAPALPVVDGMYVIEIPADGLLQTSTALEDGWAKDLHFQHQGSELKSLEHLQPVGASAGRDKEVLETSTATIGSCASVKDFYVGERAKFEEKRDAMEQKLLATICKLK